MMKNICSIAILSTALAAAQDVGAAISGIKAAHGVVPCGSQLVDPNHYTCFDNRIACPAPKTQLCGVDACYNPSEYHCLHGQLIQGKDVNHKTVDLSGISGLTSGKSGSYGIVVPGPGAYEQLLSDLGRDGLHTKQIDQVKDILNAHGFSLTSPQVAVILKDPHGAEAALEKFGSALSTQDAVNLEKAMPQVDVVLASVGQTKTRPAKPVPGPGMSGMSGGNSSTATGMNSNGVSDGSGTSGSPALSGQAAQLAASMTVLSTWALFGAALVLFF